MASGKPHLIVTEFQAKKGDTLHTDEPQKCLHLYCSEIACQVTVESNSSLTQLERDGKRALIEETVQDMWGTREARQTVKGSRTDYMWATLKATCKDK